MFGVECIYSVFCLTFFYFFISGVYGKVLDSPLFFFLFAMHLRIRYDIPFFCCLSTRFVTVARRTIDYDEG